jgi:hypothetical protein
MFKRLFFLGLASALLSMIVGVVYTIGYKPIADFTDGLSIPMFSLDLLLKSLAFTMGASILYFGIKSVFRNTSIAEFVHYLLVSIVCLTLVLLVISMQDPEFKTLNAQENSWAYKGYVMPLIFFPALSWITLKSLFVKQ